MTDVDESYDPQSGRTLDEHRFDAFKALKESGFAQPSATLETVVDPLQPESTDELVGILVKEK